MISSYRCLRPVPHEGAPGSMPEHADPGHRERVFVMPTPTSSSGVCFEGTVRLGHYVLGRHGVDPTDGWTNAVLCDRRFGDPGGPAQGTSLTGRTVDTHSDPLALWNLR